MNALDKYDHLSERLPNDSTFEQRFKKYEKIFAGLKQNNINVTDVGAAITVQDFSCGFKLGHAQASWEVYTVANIIDMIVTARDNYIKRTEQ